MLLTYRTLPYILPAKGEIISRTQIELMVKNGSWEIESTNNGLLLNTGFENNDTFQLRQYLLLPIENGIKYIVAYEYF